MALVSKNNNSTFSDDFDLVCVHIFCFDEFPLVSFSVFVVLKRFILECFACRAGVVTTSFQVGWHWFQKAIIRFILMISI